MPECQVYGCINKSEEGTSKGKKIFEVPNNKWHGIPSFIAGQFMHQDQTTDAFHTVKVKLPQLSPKMFTISLFFFTDTIQYTNL